MLSREPTTCAAQCDTRRSATAGRAFCFPRSHALHVPTVEARDCALFHRCNSGLQFINPGTAPYKFASISRLAESNDHVKPNAYRST